MRLRSINALTTLFYILMCCKNPGFIASNAFSFDTEVQQNDYIPESNTDVNTNNENFESERIEAHSLSKNVRPTHTQHTLVKNIPSTRLENRYKKKGPHHVPSFKTEFSTYRGPPPAKSSARVSDSARDN